MKRIRYISGEFPSSFISIGEKLNLDVSLVGIQTMLLEEQSDSYIGLKAVLESKKIKIYDELERILFEKNEIQEAETLALLKLGSKVVGYPQPSSKFRYRDIVYDNFCHNCGVHDGQINPISINKIPQWNSKFHWFSINWINDVSFISRDFYDKYFEPLGIEYWPVIDFKSNKIIDHIVQLKFSVLSDDLSKHFIDFPKDVCSECSRIKYSPKYLDYFPNAEIQNPMMMTNEFFGSGGSAHRQIIIRKDVVSLLQELGWIKCDTYSLWPSKPKLQS